MPMAIVIDAGMPRASIVDIGGAPEDWRTSIDFADFPRWELEAVLKALDEVSMDLTDHLKRRETSAAGDLRKTVLDAAEAQGTNREELDKKLIVTVID